MKTKTKKTVKRVVAKEKKLKEVSPKIQKLINLGFRVTRPNTESRWILDLCGKKHFKANRYCKVISLPKFKEAKEATLCQDAQRILTHETGLKFAEKVYAKTKNRTMSKKKIISFKLVK